MERDISRGANTISVLRRVVDIFTRLYGRYPHNIYYNKMLRFVTRLLDIMTRHRNTNHIQNAIRDRINKISEEMGELQELSNFHVVRPRALRSLENTTHAPHQHRRHGSRFF